jgi:hypothetical protein
VWVENMTLLRVEITQVNLTDNSTSKQVFSVPHAFYMETWLLYEITVTKTRLVLAMNAKVLLDTPLDGSGFIL